MKKYWIYILGLVSLAGSSCEDNRMNGMEPDKVYLVKRGFQEETAYPIGRTATASAWTYKSSVNYAPCQVRYEVDPTLIDTYNAENGTNYALLPEDCYTLPQTEFDLSGKEHYARFRIEYSPEKILEYCNGEYDLTRYVLPLTIKVDGVPVTNEITDADYTLIAFRIKKPAIKILSPEFDLTNVTVGEADTLEFTIPVGTDFVNPWEIPFGFSTAADELENAVQAYNAANNSTRSLLPADAYAFEPASPAIAKEQQTADVVCRIDKAKIPFGKYLLPVVIGTVDPPVFIDGTNRVSYIPIDCIADRLARDAWTVTASSDNPNYGEGIKAMTDDNTDSYWHMWAQKPDNAPWIQVDMGERAEICQVEIWPRRVADQGGVPTAVGGITISVSDDGTSWTSLGRFAWPQQATTSTLYFTVEQTVARYVKIDIEKKANQIAFNELFFRGQVIR